MYNRATGRLLGADYRPTDNQPVPYQCISSTYSLNCHIGAMLVFRMLCRITQSSDVHRTESVSVMDHEQTMGVNSVECWTRNNKTSLAISCCSGAWNCKVTPHKITVKYIIYYYVFVNHSQSVAVLYFYQQQQGTWLAC